MISVCRMQSTSWHYRILGEIYSVRSEKTWLGIRPKKRGLSANSYHFSISTSYPKEFDEWVLYTIHLQSMMQTLQAISQQAFVRFILAWCEFLGQFQPEYNLDPCYCLVYYSGLPPLSSWVLYMLTFLLLFLCHFGALQVSYQNVLRPCWLL